MKIQVYNSLTNKIEEFKPITPGVLTMYVCGPTVYNDVHIGNVRPVVLFDTIARFFKAIGYQVKYVSNFTDIDDKIIRQALKENMSEKEIAEKYIVRFMEVCDGLNCEPLFDHPRVTNWMDAITSFIKELIDQDLAYIVEDNVYFRIKKAPHYGILSNQKIDDLDVGSRIEVESKKEDPRDFVLWKLTSDDGIKWDSPFGKGRPGWHTECCVMIDKIFGGKIDIHGGGNDLKFPHHENEIAQVSALHHHDIANYWIHNGRVDINNEKMSKSVGNVVLAKDLLEKYNHNGIRLMLLATNYRQNFNFTYDLLNQVCQDYDKMERTYIQIYRYLELNDLFKDSEPLDHYNDFLNALANDFNTPNALTALQQVLKEANVLLRQKEKDAKMFNQYFITLKKMFYCFGLVPNVKPLTEEDKTLVKAWQKARNDKNFALADELRQEITAKGIVL